MERFMEEASCIKELLPWITTEEEIVNFMRKIPLDNSCIRNHLTIRYFLNCRDFHDNEFNEEIDKDAKKIIVLLPNIASYEDIKDRLTVLGNLPNRKEVVIRQLLQEHKHLNKIVRQIDVNGNNKRKSETLNNSDLEPNTSRNLKIKIRRQTVSEEIAEQEKLSPKKKETWKIESLPDSYSSSDSPPMPSVFGSTLTSPDLMSFSPIKINNNIAPATEIADFQHNLRNDHSNVVHEHNSTTSESAMPVKTRSRNNNNNIETATNETINETVNYDQPSTSKASTVMIKPSILSKQISYNSYNNNNGLVAEEFNLIEYLKEVTYASNERILLVCKKYNLKQNERPNDKLLNSLLHKLLDGEPVEISDNDSEDYEDSGSDYNTPNSKEVPNTKEFKLRPSVLNLNYERITTNNNSETKVINIKPATFVPTMQLHQDIPKDLPQNQEINENLEVPNLNVTETDVPMDVSTSSNNNNIIHKKVCNDLDLLEAGPSNAETQKKRVIDERLVFKLMEMFPEALPDYIRDLCDGKQWIDFDSIVTNILSDEDYPKRPQRSTSPIKEVDPEEQFEIVKKFLPDADPDYLRMQCEKYANDDKGLELFVNEAMELKNYPTLKDYLRKQQLSAQQKQYTTDFNIEHFIELFPDPFKTFMDPDRKMKMDPFSSHYISAFFKNRYDKIPVRSILHVLNKHDYKILDCDETFKNMVKTNLVMKSRRKPISLPDSQNIPVLQELAFLKHKSVIEQYLKDKKIREENERLEAKKNGLMESCGCCFDDEVMPKDTFTCPNGCKFCRSCIQKSSEVALGEGKTTFPCLADCPDEFSLQTLQSVLPPKMFSKLAQKKALAEIKAAGIEELEMCPFCDFATIPNEADKIFRCLNPDCMKESCRLCKEPNHVPLKCDEVEKDEDVKARTYIENKMSEALIRKCWKCDTSFFKEEGCNKMTCSCGAQMCYICKQPVADYSHFNGIGGDKFDLCPLYSDTNLINEQNVLGAAKTAKAEVDPTKLKVDPTVDVKEHFENRKKVLPREPHLDLINQVQNYRIPPAIPQFNHNQVQVQRFLQLPQLNAPLQVRRPEDQQRHNVRVIVRRVNHQPWR